MNTAQAQQGAQPQAAPIHWMAQGRLYRAIVSLPSAMCPKDEPLHERIVFFDGPRENPHAHLEALLAHAWNTSTAGWCENGHIYNLQSAIDLLEEGMSEDRNARLFETSWGGAEDIGYADGVRTDFFVAPVLKGALLNALARLVLRPLTQEAAA